MVILTVLLAGYGNELVLAKVTIWMCYVEVVAYGFVLIWSQAPKRACKDWGRRQRW
jgi:hypothetical protein